MLEQDDLVLADRGFLIGHDLAAHGAALAIPAFTKGKKQLSAFSTEQRRRLAQIQIHVERIMERIKNFSIISIQLPMSFVPHIDNILIICGTLSNLERLFVANN